MLEETWKPIPGFEGAYEVSNLGRVRSVDREWFQVGRGGKPYLHRKTGRILRAAKCSVGYYTVVLGRRAGSFPVHTLVALAFIGPRPERHDVRHLNDVRDDNRSINLAYGTRAENMQDSIRNGTYMSAKRAAFLASGNARRGRSCQSA